MRKKVYISSTYKDLVSYRKSIIDMFQNKALQDEYSLIAMEGYLPEVGKKAIQVCIDDVESADVYVLILAKRYGSMVKETGLSYTEMEYDAAKKKAENNPNYKIFVFYSNEDSEENDFVELKDLENDNLQKFYDKALNENSAFIHPFSTPDNLCKQLLLTFVHNFKKLSNYSDYENAMILIDRVPQTNDFSRMLLENVSSFHFTSRNANSPKDFVERIHRMEMGDDFNKCHTSLTTISIEHEKFRKELNDKFIDGWSKGVNEFTNGYQFDNSEKLFLSIEVNVFDFKCEKKMDCLYHFLIAFLPHYLITKPEQSRNHLFIMYYTYLDKTESEVKQFETFIAKIAKAIGDNTCLTEIDELKEVSRDDTASWLKEFVKFKRIDDVEMDELLGADELENPWGPFTMKKVKKDIKDYLEEELQNKN
ncbi:DUF4062 domain-containing protein [Flagellimonas algicola]|uniref:DUF4062 domain-containing protein n=1 Tax=Flagellimonas algicola TaxID=2583815 RepID=A0ABY2WR87_9FLAO|nr:DUF4062 domain-containing protein [Allomuricauda algicola]TMU57458.1 DUF4062 domain-containing protein [Allomuricauda algicola]